MTFTRTDASEHSPGGVFRFIAHHLRKCACGTFIGLGDRAGYIDDDLTASCPDCCDEAEDNDCA